MSKSGRNILFLSHRIPYPPDKGEKIRAWHMLERLARSNEILLGTFVDDPADWKHLPFLRDLCASVACFDRNPARQRVKALLRMRPGRALSLDYFRDARLTAWVNVVLKQQAVSGIFVFSSPMAQYVMDACCPIRVLDMVDVDSDKWAEYSIHARWPMRNVWSREARTLLAFERKATKRFDRTLFVSEHEAQRFRALAPESTARTRAIENGVDYRFFSPNLSYADPYPAECSLPIVFTGAMDYWPNIDGVCWFAREVLPSIRRRHPEAQFYIVGSNPAREVRALQSLAGVHVTGRVPDTRPWIAHAKLAVAPLRVARGIQNKVLEALAMARPVVASPQAYAGLRLIPGLDLLIAETAEETIQRCCEILNGQHALLGKSARRAIEQTYDWDVTLRELDALFDCAAEASRSTRSLTFGAAE